MCSDGPRTTSRSQYTCRREAACFLLLVTDSYTTVQGDCKRRKWAAEWDLESYGRSPTVAALQPGNPGLKKAPLLFNQFGFIKIKSSGKCIHSQTMWFCCCCNQRQKGPGNSTARGEKLWLAAGIQRQKIKFRMLPDKLLSSHRGERHFMIFSNCDVFAQMEAWEFILHSS